MRKTALLLALLLALSGCQQPAVPTSGSSQPAGDASVSAPADGQTVQVSSQAGKPLSETAPKPVTPPPTAVGAATLPKQLAEATDGYSLDLLTPAQYDAFLDSGRGGPRGYLTADLFVLGQGGKVAVANLNGKLVTDFVYDEVQDGYWDAPGGYLAMKKDGKIGLINAADGKEVLPCVYDYIRPVYLGGSEYSEVLVEARKQDVTEILDMSTGEARFTLERGDELYSLTERYVLLQGGMLRFYDRNFKPVKNFVCDAVQLAARISDGQSEDLLAVDCSGAWGLVDQDGNFLADPVYDEIGYFQGDYASMTKAGKRGVIDYQGEVVIKPEWTDLALYEHSVSVCQEGRWGVITDIDSGVVAISPRYDFIQGYGENGYACYERNGKYGLIDKEGNEIISARYDNPINTNANLDKGYYMIEGNDGPGTAGIVDGNGKILISADYYIYPGQEGEAYNLISTPGDKWGFIDRTGQFVIDAKYDYADKFIPGKNVAFANKGGKIVLLDRKGNEVLKTVFSDVIGFNPETMVCAMEYKTADGTAKTCLVKLGLPA